VELSFLHTLEENANPVKIAISLNKSTKKKYIKIMEMKKSTNNKNSILYQTENPRI
jgi:hypothetical protein